MSTRKFDPITVSRCIFPGGKAVLVAYDAQGQFLMGIGKNPPNVARWVMKGVTAADRREMEAEVIQIYA